MGQLDVKLIQRKNSNIKKEKKYIKNKEYNAYILRNALQ